MSDIFWQSFFGLLTAILAAVAAYKTTQTHKAVNSRMDAFLAERAEIEDQLLAQSKIASKAVGVAEGRAEGKAEARVQASEVAEALATPSPEATE